MPAMWPSDLHSPLLFQIQSLSAQDLCADPYCSFLILPATVFRRQHRSPTVLLSIPSFCLNRPSLQLPEALPAEQWATQAREAGRQSSELYALSFAPNPIPRLIPSSVADSQLWLLLFLPPFLGDKADPNGGACFPPSRDLLYPVSPSQSLSLSAFNTKNILTGDHPPPVGTLIRISEAFPPRQPMATTLY